MQTTPLTEQTAQQLITSLDNLTTAITNQQTTIEPAIIWRTAYDVAQGLKIPEKTARKLIAMPLFPKPILPRKGKNKLGPWRSCEVIDFYRINHNKIWK